MIEKNIKELIVYAEKHLSLEEEDAVYFQNILLKIFRRSAPYSGAVDEEKIAALAVPDEVLAPLRVYLEKSLGYLPGPADRELTYIMGLLSPLPSQVNQAFEAYYAVDPKMATDYLYDLSIKNNYIAKTQVDRNIVWDADYGDGPSLEISINLSKPEKDNKDIAKLVASAPSSDYPKCLLCHENLGFAGTDSKPARENIRFVPVSLDGERWYLQYSPYVYYPYHLICFYEKHENMEISPRILSKLFAFVDLFPHFFVGSNSDLPIVGGSILNHEHFQGGGHLMPMMKAKARRKEPTNPKFPDVGIEVLDFYDTVIRLSSSSREEVLGLGWQIASAWRNYDDPDFSILAKEGDVQHSTVTPIARKEEGVYQLYIILRNNRCDEQYPDGIFHAHPEYHMIKKEGIGLIEAMGRFILPARLQRQSHLIEEILANKYPQDKYLAEHPDLQNFVPMIEELRKSGATVRDYINQVCQGILRNVAVYKEDEAAQKALDHFMEVAQK